MRNVQITIPPAGGLPHANVAQGNIPHGSVAHGAEPALRSGFTPDQALQELWLSLSAAPWRSLVLVPADAATSAALLARSLAAVGTELSAAPVTAFVGEGALEWGAALAMIDGGAASSRVVVAIPPVVIEPRGAVLARRADAVVACVAKGRTRLCDVRRTLELIGAERFLGSVLVR
jgi:hypothetical protein